MHPTPLLARLGFAMFLILAAANAASAQSRVYVGGTAIADIRRFDSIQYDPRVLASFFSGMSLDGTTAGGGARVGTFVHPMWSLEFAVDAGSMSTNVFPNPVQSLPSRSSTLRLPQISNGTSFLTFSTVVGFHPGKMGRLRLGYLGGLTLVRGTYESTIPEFGIPTDVTPVPDFRASFTIFPSLPSPVIESRSLRRIDNSVGGILGLEAAVDVSEHLAVVPGIRTIVFSNSGRSVFLIRPEAGVRWSF